MRTILLCVDDVHAEVVDGFVWEAVKEKDGANGSGWSGVWTDGKRYGIIWASPVSDIFGVPEDFPELELVEDTENQWRPHEQPPPQE